MKRRAKQSAIATLVTACLVIAIANASPPPSGWQYTPPKAVAYKDPRTSITLYVESDGRHVAAIDADGRLLWVRNPYEEGGLHRVEGSTPVIVRIRQRPPPDADFAVFLQRHNFRADDKLVEIQFANSAFGVLDERTGDFVPVGAN